MRDEHFRFLSESAIGDSGMVQLEWEPVGSHGDRARIERAVSEVVRDKLRENGALNRLLLVSEEEIDAGIDEASGVWGP